MTTEDDRRRRGAWTRRQALTAGTAIVGGLTAGVRTAAAGGSGTTAEGTAAAARQGRGVHRGRLKQSVARWCYSDIPLADLCAAVAELGLPAIDLLEAEEWPVAAAHGLTVGVGYVGAGSIAEGVNDPANHDRIVDAFREHMPAAAEAGVANVICFFGNRLPEMSEEDAIANSIAALRRCAPIAEEHGVTILVELLNSKVDHRGYIGDTTGYGARVLEAVASERVKLLYDIYHMQIMEGDVIRTIRDHSHLIGHFHTGGVPGRGEIDETQELYYPAIARAIVDTGYEGYFAHEFVPRSGDALGSLAAAVELCDV